MPRMCDDNFGRHLGLRDLRREFAERESRVDMPATALAIAVRHDRELGVRRVVLLILAGRVLASRILNGCLLSSRFFSSRLLFGRCCCFLFRSDRFEFVDAWPNADQSRHVGQTAS